MFEEDPPIIKDGVYKQFIGKMAIVIGIVPAILFGVFSTWVAVPFFLLMAATQCAELQIDQTTVRYRSFWTCFLGRSVELKQIKFFYIRIITGYKTIPRTRLRCYDKNKKLISNMLVTDGHKAVSAYLESRGITRLLSDDNESIFE